MDDKHRDELLHQIYNAVLENRVRISRLELHLNRQDREMAEMLAACRRLMLTIQEIDRLEAIAAAEEDDEDEDEAPDPLQN